MSDIRGEHTVSWSPRVPKVTFIVGLCGSGKTYSAAQIAEQTGAQVFHGVMNIPERAAILRRLLDGKNCVVEGTSFCYDETRRDIAAFLSAVPGVEIEWCCFENDLESADWNVTHRKNQGNPEVHRRINADLHPCYTYPPCAKIIQITRVPAG